MKKLGTALLVLTVLTGCTTKMESMPAERPVQAKAEPQRSMPEMSPDEMMSKMQEAGTPGQDHAQLKPLVGKWKTESKFWMEPGKDPEVTKVTANHQWALGKRFVKEDYTGKWNGQPFQGTGMLGYDKVKKAYISTWTDSMGTGIMLSEGKYDPSAKTLTMSSTYSCPLTGGDKEARTVTRILSNNEHVFEMYDKGPDGKEMKVMEIKYKRAS